MKLDLKLKPESNNYWKDIQKFLNKGNRVELVKRAYDFACRAHENQKRESGESFISHPVWVAKVTAQMNIGDAAICAALLHDVVEDTEINIEKVAKEFGDEIALLVDGLTEVKKITKGIELHKENIEIFRKFLFSSINDMRVLIIRLIDKLHNGLTVEALPRERRINYAKRIFGIYSPVAEYVGLHYFKRLLDDIAFEILYPKEAKNLKWKLSRVAKTEKKTLKKIKGEIERMLRVNKIKNFQVRGRIKSLYSTYQKSKVKEVKDRVGIRILTKDIDDCYTTLGLIHSKYEYFPKEFDDYISRPKENGYRSIQTTVRFEKTTAEIQIRTHEMHDFDEFGPASHIAYKIGREAGGVGYEWVRDLVRWQKEENGVNKYKVKVLTDFVYVFTPRGDVIQMPAGSTVLDFAYRIHSDIGDRFFGAKINGKIVKIRCILKTGDLVEILTIHKKTVNRDWLKIATTKSAREHIRNVISLDK